MQKVHKKKDKSNEKGSQKASQKASKKAFKNRCRKLMENRCQMDSKMDVKPFEVKLIFSFWVRSSLIEALGPLGVDFESFSMSPGLHLEAIGHLSFWARTLKHFGGLQD